MSYHLYATVCLFAIFVLCAIIGCLVITFIHAYESFVKLGYNNALTVITFLEQPLSTERICMLIFRENTFGTILLS